MLEDRRALVASRSFWSLGRHSRLLIVSVTTLAIACIGSISSAAARVGAVAPTLTIAGPTGCPTNLSPATGNGGGDQLMGAGAGAVYETLVKTGLRGLRATLGSGHPALATSWVIYPGNKQIKLTLRRGIRFTDGSLFDASVVKAWMEFLERDPRGGGYSAANGAPLRSVQVLTKYSVLITFESPSPNMLGLLAATKVPSPRAIAQYAADPKSDIFNKASYGTGPYEFDPSQSVLGDHCTYLPNPRYYDKTKQKWSKIVTRSMTDPNSILAAMETGQVDVAVGDPTTAAAAASAGLRINVLPADGTFGGGFDGIWLVDRNGAVQRALEDVRVRQALNYAIDRKTITAALFGKYGSPTSLCFTGSDDGSEPRLLNYYTYNPAKAKALLAAAGYPNGFSFTVVASSSPAVPYSPIEMAQAVAKSLAAVGVTMNINDPSSADWYTTSLSGNFSGVALAIGRVPGTQWRLFLDKPGNFGDQHGWRDPVTDRLTLRAARLDQQHAQLLYQQAQDRCVTGAYELPVSSASMLVYVSKRLGGVRFDNAFMSPVDWYPTNAK